MLNHPSNGKEGGGTCQRAERDSLQIDPGWGSCERPTRLEETVEKLKYAILEHSKPSISSQIDILADGMPLVADEALDLVFMDLFPLVCSASIYCDCTSAKVDEILQAIVDRMNPREVLLLVCDQLAKLVAPKDQELDLICRMVKCLTSCLQHHVHGLASSLEVALPLSTNSLLTVSKMVSIQGQDLQVVACCRSILFCGTSFIQECVQLAKSSLVLSQNHKIRAILSVALVHTLGALVLPFPWENDIQAHVDPLLVSLMHIVQEHHQTVSDEICRCQLWSLMEKLVQELVHSNCVEVHSRLLDRDVVNTAMEALKFVLIVSPSMCQCCEMKPQELLACSTALILYSNLAGLDCIRKATLILDIVSKELGQTCDPIPSIPQYQGFITDVIRTGPSEESMLISFANVYAAILETIVFQEDSDLRKECSDYLREAMGSLNDQSCFDAHELLLTNASLWHPAAIAFVLSSFHMQLVKRFPVPPYGRECSISLLRRWLEPGCGTWSTQNELEYLSVPVCAAANTLYFLLGREKTSKSVTFNHGRIRIWLHPLKSLLDDEDVSSSLPLGPLSMVISSIWDTLSTY